MPMETVTPVSDDSILYTVKKLSGLNPSFQDDFDLDLIVFINGIFTSLSQLGVGPEEGFTISGYDETWESYGEEPAVLNMVKPYLYLSVRMQFDPPTVGAVKEAYENQIKEYTWRLNVQVDPRRNSNLYEYHLPHRGSLAIRCTRLPRRIRRLHERVGTER